MKTYYEESDLVSFGLYLLSDKRNDSILKNNNNDADFTKVIYDADLANWKHKISQENLSTAEPGDVEALAMLGILKNKS